MARRKSAASSTTKVETGGAAPEAAVEQVAAPAAPDVQEAAQAEPAAAAVEQVQHERPPAGEPQVGESEAGTEAAAEAQALLDGAPQASEAAAEPVSEHEALAVVPAEVVADPAPAEQAPADGEVCDQAAECDAMSVWLNTTVFPVQITLRNHGSMPKVEPISGAYLDAGGVASVTLHNPEHAVSVLDNLSALNDDDTGATRGLVADELPFALTKKKG